MLGSEYGPDNYETLKISFRAIIKNPEVLRFVPNHRNTKSMCKNTVKKLPFGIMYFPDLYKAQQMRDKVVLEKVEMLRFVPDCYKNQKMCDS